MQKWEYLKLESNIKNRGVFGNNPTYAWEDDKSNPMSFQERLNFLGNEGWELVSSFPTLNGYFLILKRPKE
jgi:hypothetical protein